MKIRKAFANIIIKDLKVTIKFLKIKNPYDRNNYAETIRT